MRTDSLREQIKNQIKDELIDKCKIKLLTLKSQLLNQIKTAAADFNAVDKSRGDESDLSMAHQEEHNFLANQDRLKNQLIEIDFALARIERGTYGICEETEESIEADRLLAIPWTRLSIEGAEIREAMVKKTGKSYASTT